MYYLNATKAGNAAKTELAVIETWPSFGPNGMKKMNKPNQDDIQMHTKSLKNAEILMNMPIERFFQITQ